MTAHRGLWLSDSLADRRYLTLNAPPDRAPELCAHGQHRNAASVAVHGLPDRRKSQLLVPAAD
jgi:hypothetical protein